MTRIAVVHLARASNGDRPLRRFLDSYRQHPAGMAHELVILFKGYADRGQLAAHRALLEDLPYRPIDVPDDGFDIGSYRLAARQLDHDLLMFLNSYSRILADGWLAKLTRPFAERPVGLVGATGSWQSIFSDWEYLGPRWWIKWVLGAAVRRFQVPAYPNPHVRSNAFVVPRELFLSLRIPAIRTKRQAWLVESGRYSLTRQVLKRGYAVLVVGRDGIAYPPRYWMQSGTFRSRDQRNLLVADNQTELLDFADPIWRATLDTYAWLHPLFHRQEMQSPPWRAIRRSFFHYRGNLAFQAITIPNGDAGADSTSGTETPAGAEPRSASGMRIPFVLPARYSGWVRLDFTLTTHPSRPALPRIVYRGGADLYPFRHAGTSRYSAYLNLRHTGSALILDPQLPPDAFTFERAHIAEVTLFGAALSTIRRHPILLKEAWYAGWRAVLDSIRGKRRPLRAAVETIGVRIAQLKNQTALRGNRAYEEWLALSAPAAGPARPNPPARPAAQAPVLSVVLEGHACAAVHAKATFESVLAQCNPRWELLVTGEPNGSANYPIAGADSRIRRVSALGEDRVCALNAALDKAQGRFACFLQTGDVLAPEAAQAVADLGDEEAIDIVYSDEDCIDETGRRRDVFFKPDWSPEYLESCNYIGRMTCFRLEGVRGLGGLRSDMRLAAEFDLTLRLSESGGRIVHLPKVLYSRRAAAAAGAGAKCATPWLPNAPDAELAVAAHQQRVAGSSDVVRLGPILRARYPIHGNPKVSVIIPTAGQCAWVRGRWTDLLTNCVSTVGKEAGWSNLEWVVVHNGNLARTTLDMLNSLRASLVLYEDADVNIARKMNLGARAATGEYLLFLNDDIEARSKGVIEELVRAMQPRGVGAVGAKLYYEDLRIQHAGVVFAGALPHMLYWGARDERPGYFGALSATRNYLAVTGACLMTSKAAFAAAGGFDEKLKINCNDIDYCLTLGSKGYRVVFDPSAELFHFESKSRNSKELQWAEFEHFLMKWRRFSGCDPFYSRWFAGSPTFDLRV